MATSRDVYNAPAYSILEASWYLRMPQATLRSWIAGRPYPVRSGVRRFEPVIELTDPECKHLSFINLVEAHVLCGIRRKYKVGLPKVREAVRFLREHFQSRHPLVEQQFETDGINLFIEKVGSLINVSSSGQMAMRQVLHFHLQRIERDDEGFPIRLYPIISRMKGDDASKGPVVIDPAISFGRPIIRKLGIPTALIAERFDAGETIASIAADYEAEPNDIEEAIRAERQVHAA
jgi:uncharacterized protein (DUF433 family)